VLCAGTLLAQHSNNGNGNDIPVVDPAKFWQSPGETDRDSKGNVTYTEIKDAKSFTKRIFTNGEWATYHYRPGTVELTSIDNSDSTEELHYDEARNFNGITVNAGGKSHTLKYDRSKGSVTADNLPTVTVERDSSSPSTRDLLVRSGKNVVASIEYTPTGEVAKLNVGAMTLSFTPADTYMKETLTVNGTVLKEANATVAIKRTFTMFLDPVAERLHLGKDWAAQTRSRATQSGYLNTLQQGTAVLARMVRMGEMQAGFAADGSPLLYDLTINYGPGGGMAQQRDYKIAALYAASLQTHIIITSDGDVGAYVETPGSGSIRAFWTSNKGGQTQYNYSVYDSGRPSAKSSMSRSITSTSNESLESNTLTDKKRVVAPKTMMICDSTQTCVSGGDQCPSCGTCATYYYYCDTGTGGGGGYSPPPDDGSGAGSGGVGSRTSNNYILDGNLHIAVNRAIIGANGKLSNDQCGVQLLANATWGNTSALNELTLRGGGVESAKDWFGTISWRDGAGMRDSSNHEICGYACAFTSPGDTTDYICPSFSQRAYPANTLIHEMLHTLGLPECNPNNPCATPGAMTPSQIDALVAQYCG